MPTKVSVGLSKKAGLPDYGSIGSSCHVELELDPNILDGDLDRFRQNVRRAYAACREAVEEELSRNPAETGANSNRLNGHSNGNGHPPNNGHSHYGQNSSNGRRSANGRAATQSQVRAIKAIVSRGRINLGPLLDRFGVSAAEYLDIGQASELIDELKGQAAGNGSSR